jgi:hypothetical protein
MRLAAGGPRRLHGRVGPRCRAASRVEPARRLGGAGGRRRVPHPSGVRGVICSGTCLRARQCRRDRQCVHRPWPRRWSDVARTRGGGQRDSRGVPRRSRADRRWCSAAAVAPSPAVTAACGAVSLIHPRSTEGLSFSKKVQRDGEHDDGDVVRPAAGRWPPSACLASDRGIWAGTGAQRCSYLRAQPYLS